MLRKGGLRLNSLTLDASTIIAMALADSIDPCFFALYTGILASYSMGDIRRLAKVAMIFILSVCTGYSILGFILRSILREFSLKPVYVSLLLAAYGLIIISHGLYSYVKQRKPSEAVCRDDMVECRLANRLGLRSLIEKGSLVYVALTGLIACFTLLPCSAGMYVVYSVLMREAPIILWIPYTILYVAVFTMPLVLITLAFAGLSRLAFYERILRHQDAARIAGGILSVGIAIYIYFHH
ncbi:MAG: transmembrane electron transporter [Desulfurococcus sp.]|nr:transmembrane electron transporter [Desulfurococcus sp.]